jgi:hypothetical protein
MKKLLTVYDRFEVLGRGTVIVVYGPDHSVGVPKGTEFVLAPGSGATHKLVAADVSLFTKCFTRLTTLGIFLGNQIAASVALRIRGVGCSLI